MRWIAGIVMLAMPGVTWAGPWAEAGDIRLRHDLLLLSDHGLLNVPITTWPVKFGDVSGSLRVPSGRSDGWLAPARSRVEARLRRESSIGFGGLDFSVSFAQTPAQLRGFGDQPRGDAELGLGISFLGDWYAWRLNVQAAEDSIDGEATTFDGSYAGLTAGNWIFSINTLGRWWGPGWDGSLILGHTARPFPALVVERNQSLSFDLPILRLLGPWSAVAFMGQLEAERVVPDALIFGARVAFKPTEKLEVALVRTAQWAGEDRPSDFDTFIDLLVGRDNRGINLSAEEEPGNQLAGMDFRWRSPLFGDFPFAVYGQIIGEDEAGGLPSREFVLGGLEIWGGVGLRSWRGYLEFAETTAGRYFGDTLENYVYEHGIYRSGYRYHGLPIGHSMDNDSQSISVGGIVVNPDGSDWSIRALSANLNRDGSDVLIEGAGHSISFGGRTNLFQAQLLHSREFQGGRLRLGLGYEGADSDFSGGENDVDFQLFASWSISL